jgi:hypothetical protein
MSFLELIIRELQMANEVSNALGHSSTRKQMTSHELVPALAIAVRRTNLKAWMQ